MKSERQQLRVWRGSQQVKYLIGTKTMSKSQVGFPRGGDENLKASHLPIFARKWGHNIKKARKPIKCVLLSQPYIMGN